MVPCIYNQGGMFGYLRARPSTVDPTQRKWILCGKFGFVRLLSQWKWGWWGLLRSDGSWTGSKYQFLHPWSFCVGYSPLWLTSFGTSIKNISCHSSRQYTYVQKGHVSVAHLFITTYCLVYGRYSCDSRINFNGQNLPHRHVFNFCNTSCCVLCATGIGDCVNIKFPLCMQLALRGKFLSGCNLPQSMANP